MTPDFPPSGLQVAELVEREVVVVPHSVGIDGRESGEVVRFHHREGPGVLGAFGIVEGQGDVATVASFGGTEVVDQHFDGAPVILIHAEPNLLDFREVRVAVIFGDAEVETESAVRGRDRPTFHAHLVAVVVLNDDSQLFDFCHLEFERQREGPVREVEVIELSADLEGSVLVGLQGEPRGLGAAVDVRRFDVERPALDLPLVEVLEVVDSLPGVEVAVRTRERRSKFVDDRVPSPLLFSLVVFAVVTVLVVWMGETVVC
ncbi:hypothetical protein [Haloarcula sp. JP-L23]|uniref:hypothetical protein n=1 Tax=Haloarcula sp. JP-L23 TaxID=2716717 RepID=UPI00140F19E5|nr:hypothetical protein G9465_17910 [Haloarcula sp. JP-L23]